MYFQEQAFSSSGEPLSDVQVRYVISYASISCADIIIRSLFCYSVNTIVEMTKK